MIKAKYLVGLFLMVALLFVFPNVSNAAEVTVTRDVYSNNGSMKFNFKGLNLNITHEYEFGFTKTAAAEVENWHLIADYTEDTATINIISTTKDLLEVINSVDTGYIRIKDKNDDTIVMQPYAVDLKIPFLQVTNYTVITNGKNLDGEAEINLTLRDPYNCKPYYQYEKITDQNIINKYKEIKEKNGNFMELQSMLKTTTPSSNWSNWDYWNGVPGSGHGFPVRTVSVQDNGLYYLWVYFSGENKDLYGCILVDNLQPDVAVESLTLSKTETVELGKTLTLSPGFTPTTATNKIVTWSSSDESVATVDNAGKITPKKVGSTVITVTSQDGNKTASCTVTVTQASNNNGSNNNNSNNSGSSSSGSNSSSSTSGSSSYVNDPTVAQGKIPQTGATMTFALVVIALLGSAVLGFVRFNKLKDI